MRPDNYFSSRQEYQRVEIMVINAVDLDEIKQVVKGTTLKVYLLLARSKSTDFGVREIQRQLNFSSVSLASYHLNRLEELDLVTKTPQNRYKVNKVLPIGQYEDFFVLKGRYLPKEAFFLAFFSFATFFSVIFLLLQFWGPMLSLLFSIAVIASLSSWYRFVKYWKIKDQPEIE